MAMGRPSMYPWVWVWTTSYSLPAFSTETPDAWKKPPSERSGPTSKPPAVQSGSTPKPGPRPSQVFTEP